MTSQPYYTTKVELPPPAQAAYEAAKVQSKRAYDKSKSVVGEAVDSAVGRISVLVSTQGLWRFMGGVGREGTLLPHCLATSLPHKLATLHSPTTSIHSSRLVSTWLCS